MTFGYQPEPENTVHGNSAQASPVVDSSGVPVGSSYGYGGSVVTGEKVNETPDNVISEIRRLEDEIKIHYPHAKININVGQGMSLADLQKIRDDVKDVKRAEEAKELHQELMGGAVKLVEGAALVAGGAAALAGAAVGGLKYTADVIESAVRDPSSISRELFDKNLPSGGRNAQFEKLLEGIDRKALGVAFDPVNTNMNRVEMQAGLPNLLAADKSQSMVLG